MTSKLLFVSSSTRGKEYFTQNTIPGVFCIEAEPKDTAAVINAKLAGVDLSGVTNIGIVFENTSRFNPFMEYTVDELQQQKDLDAEKAIKRAESNTRNYIEEDDITPSFYTSGQFFSNDFIAFIDDIQAKSALSAIDIISCNIIFNNQFSTLESKGITVRYSTNITGARGDWILESHDVNVTPIYFTDDVRAYPYRLGGTQPTYNASTGKYEIATADNMYWLMTCTVPAANPQVPGTPDLGSSYILTTNIDMKDVTGGDALNKAESISGIYGSTTNRFRGTLDGNNYKVTMRTLAANYCGLIGQLGVINQASTVGTLKNITVTYAQPTGVTGSVLNINSSSSATGMGFGLLCGFVRSGTINNCRVSFDNLTVGSIINTVNISLTNNGPADTGASEYGLLVGRLQGNTNTTYCNINASTVDINMYITVTSSSVRVSGLVGLRLIGSESLSFSNNNITVKNFSMNLTNNNIVNDCILIFSGLIGLVEAIGGGETPIDTCTATYSSITIASPTITSTDPGLYNIDMYTGGLIGLIHTDTTTISNCTLTTQTFNTTYNIENVTTTTTGLRQCYCGLFLASIEINVGAAAAINPLNIYSNTVNGVVNCTITNQNNLKYINRLGGLIGYINLIDSTGYDARLNIGDSTHNGITGSVSLNTTLTGIYDDAFNRELIGGLIGNINNTLTTGYCNITKIFCTSNSNSTIISNTSGVQKYIGGLVGYCNSGTLNNISYSLPSLTINSSNTTSSKLIYVGGIIGGSNQTLTISNIAAAYNILNISTKTTLDSYIGGIIGIIEGNGTLTMTNCTSSISTNAILNCVAANFSAINCIVGRNLQVIVTSITNNITNFGKNVQFISSQGITNYSYNAVGSPNENPLGVTNVSNIDGYSTASRVPLALAAYNYVDAGTPKLSVNGTGYLIDATPKNVTPAGITTYLSNLVNTTITIQPNLQQLQTLNVVTNSTTFQNSVNAAPTITNGSTVNLTTFGVGVTPAIPIASLANDADKVSARAMVIDTIFGGTNQNTLNKFLVTRDQLGLPPLTPSSPSDKVLIVRPNTTAIDVTGYVQGSAPQSGNPYGLLSNIGDQIEILYTKYFITTTQTVTRISSTQYSVFDGTSTTILTVGGVDNITINHVLTTVGSVTFSATSSECLLKGTKLLTDSGYRLVEDLKINDVLITADGKETRITQVLKRDVFPSELHQPYIVRKGEYGAIEDLYISPNHEILVDGKYVAARDLDLDRAEIKELLVYYHFSITDMVKDAIIANGVPVETLYGSKHLKA